MTPRLRVPEFGDRGGWISKTLKEFAVVIDERARDGKFILMSISSGVGLVSQIEKFGREIAGAQYKNYYVIRSNDFAYNKSATKEYPEGFLAMYSGASPGAVPNSIFTCFRVDESQVFSPYLNYLFSQNLHGRWLRKFIEVGARAHGSLNVNNGDLLAMPTPLPCGDFSIHEQRKIADCLTSIDELISVEAKKLDVLKKHKKGLMQSLFPSECETLPRLRFPEFQNGPDWILAKLGDISRVQSGGTPSRSCPDYWGGTIPWVTTSLVDSNIILNVDEYITKLGLEESSAKMFPMGTILMAMYGQGKTRGKVAMLGIDATTNQACAAILTKSGIESRFVFQSLVSRYDEIRKISNSGGQENLSAGLVEGISITYPEDVREQEKIANCLFFVDELIAVVIEEISTLRTHKMGLMQQLFPLTDKVPA